MRKWTRNVLVVVAVLLLIQLVPVTRDNPKQGDGPGAPKDVEAVLRKSCYDCHSNETVWPPYSRIAPMSWMVAHDVHEGREKLNLSELTWISEESQHKVRKKLHEEVEEGEMPLWYYLPMHPEARLTDRDKAILKTWQ